MIKPKLIGVRSSETPKGFNLDISPTLWNQTRPNF